jgi:GDPmannose 4,6-dehydratase
VKTALICGVNGQDGAYLARFLLGRGYRVVGTSRDAQAGRRHNLAALGIEGEVEIESMAPNDFRSVLQVLAKVQPSEIYYLAGQSSVSLSFEQPVETLESISTGTLNLLECIRFLDPSIRFYSAGSSECFGNTGEVPADENTPFRPRSPYAVAKACAANLVSNYREAYQLFACNGLLFNHESPLRPRRFVTRKIVTAAYRISAGLDSHVTLGNLAISRDWGWAPDYIEAMWMLLQRQTPLDVVIATGRTVSLEYFVSSAFSYFGLDWSKHVLHDSALLRPSDLTYSAANTTRASLELGWTARHSVDDVVREMCRAEHELQEQGKMLL